MHSHDMTVLYIYCIFGVAIGREGWPKYTAAGLLLLKIKEPVSSGKCGITFSPGCLGFEWAFRYQLFVADAT